MAKKRAFVKYTKKGKIIPGSLIVTTSGGHPVDGVYKEVPYDVCCDSEKKISLLFDITGAPYGFYIYVIAFGGNNCAESNFSRIDLQIESSIQINSALDWVNSLNTNANILGNFTLIDSDTIKLEFNSYWTSYLQTCDLDKALFPL